jgi:hypothetical protein
MAATKKQAAKGFWRFVGHGSRIMGVPARDLTPSESELFGDVIRQVAARGEVLYVWDTGEPPVEATPVEATPVVVAEVTPPVYEVTTTETVGRKEKPVWKPGGTEQKKDE